MAPSFIPLDRFRTKFYQKGVNSKGFLELSEENLAEVAKKVYKKQEMAADVLANGTIRFAKLERYQDTLQYLTNPLIHLEFKTFDERVAYLVMMTDPELVTFKEFLKTDLISMVDISKIEDINERSRLLRLRNQALSTYETTVREKIGFYDSNLLMYEELFFKRFFGKKELITEVGLNNQDSFISKAKSLKDFNSVSYERYNELVDIAQGWLAMAPEKYNSKVVTYSVTNQKKLLGLKSLEEQFTLFILLVDSDLDMLSIYEEESMMPKVEERIVEEFGYYNKDLLALERKFHNRFCPDKKISIWTKTKKD